MRNVELLKFRTVFVKNYANLSEIMTLIKIISKLLALVMKCVIKFVEHTIK